MACMSGCKGQRKLTRQDTEDELAGTDDEDADERAEMDDLLQEQGVAATTDAKPPKKSGPLPLPILGGCISFISIESVMDHRQWHRGSRQACYRLTERQGSLHETEGMRPHVQARSPSWRRQGVPGGCGGSSL